MGLAIARGRALAGLGSNCRTADGPVPAFTCRDQLTLHVESPLAPTMRAWMSASDAVDLCARDSVTVDPVHRQVWSPRTSGPGPFNAARIWLSPSIRQ